MVRELRRFLSKLEARLADAMIGSPRHACDRSHNRDTSFHLGRTCTVTLVCRLPLADKSPEVLQPTELFFSWVTKAGDAGCDRTNLRRQGRGPCEGGHSPAPVIGTHSHSRRTILPVLRYLGNL